MNSWKILHLMTLIGHPRLMDTQLEWSLDLANFLKTAESSIDLKTEFLTHTGSGQIVWLRRLKTIS